MLARVFPEKPKDENGMLARMKGMKLGSNCERVRALAVGAEKLDSRRVALRG